MSLIRVACFAISLDGYGAGPEQSLQNPLGVGGMNLHKWMFKTDFFQKMIAHPSGETGIDNDFAARGFENVGSWILGRNMFSPLRGPWPDDKWKGWWDDTPPYHCDVFILTHHKRAPERMKGGTTFYFETGGIEAALKKAKEAAGGKDVRVGGGPDTIRQYLKAGLIDEMHLAVAPILLGSGERLFDGINLVQQGFECTERVATEFATHVVLKKTGAGR